MPPPAAARCTTSHDTTGGPRLKPERRCELDGINRGRLPLASAPASHVALAARPAIASRADIAPMTFVCLSTRRWCPTRTARHPRRDRSDASRAAAVPLKLKSNNGHHVSCGNGVVRGPLIVASAAGQSKLFRFDRGYGYGYGYGYGNGYGDGYGASPETARRRRVRKLILLEYGDDDEETGEGSGASGPAERKDAGTSADGEKAGAGGSVVAAMNAMTNAFPLWVLAGAVVGLTNPAAVTWFKGGAITVALAVTMLGMGLTLELDDFLRAVKRPSQVALGVALQYSIMPVLGLLIGRVFPVAQPIAVGLILVGCCPGGTASNLVTYLGKANVALSVVLTTASTFLACIFTPILTKQLAGTLVPVPAGGLFFSTLQVVLLPIFAGLLLKKTFPAAVAKVVPACPLVAVVTVALICSSIIGQSAAAIVNAGPVLLLAVACLHSAGFFLGYSAAGAAGFPEADRRTVSIEVGMQNSALGVVLATAHFADPLVAVPCAISATVHSCIGSTLAGSWRLFGKKAA